MYCVIKSVVHIGDRTEVNGLPRRYAYLAGTRKIACEYLKNIYQRDLELLSRDTDCKFLGYGIGTNNRRATIEYVDKKLVNQSYQYTYVEYIAVEGHEIVKLSDVNFTAKLK